MEYLANSLLASDVSALNEVRQSSLDSLRLEYVELVIQEEHLNIFQFHEL